MNIPQISVLMPVYNGEKFLAEAIESILNQAYKDFEFLIINDGSTDRTKEIILSYTDPRIRYIENESNLKLIASLNKGIELAKGKYIARMDADDISMPDRFEKQFNFMEKHPETGLCGSRCRNISDTHDPIFPEIDEQIRFRLFFSNHFAHPTVFMRKSVLDANNLRYEQKYIHAEDYSLWLKMMKHTKLAILQEFLVLRHEHPEQVSNIYSEEQNATLKKIRYELFNEIGIDTNMEEYEIFCKYLSLNYPWDRGIFNVSGDKILLLLNLFSKIEKANLENKVYNLNLFSCFLADRYWILANNSTFIGIKLWKKFIFSFASEYIQLTLTSKFKFFIKCLVKYNYHNHIKKTDMQ